MEKTIEQETVFNTHNFDEIFPIIDPSELVGHKLLEHTSKTEWQEILLANILKGIEMKLPAFRVSCMDPSEENGKIVFKSGNKPAVGHSAAWWDETWKKFMPSKNSRSGTELHYAAFLGKLMKYLIDKKNYSVTDAWRAVCNNSIDMGHYWNSEDAKDNLEPTGSRKVGDFFDLANTSKILKSWKSSGFFYASGCFDNFSAHFPLMHMFYCYDPVQLYYHTVGWLVMDV